RLADQIINLGTRTISVADLASDEWMRSALLSDGPDSPLRGLVDDGILFVEWVPPGGHLPLPAEPHVGFTFDQLRDFVVFVRLHRRYGENFAPLTDLASTAQASSPLVGGLRFLVLERLREAAGPPAVVLNLFRRLSGPPQQALLRELFLAPVGPRLA